MSFDKFKYNIKEISEFKRVMEYCSFDKDFLSLYNSDRKKALESIGLEQLDIEQTVKLYDEFIKAKIETRDRIRENCEPIDDRFRKWRNRQVKRCEMEYAKQQSDAVVHLCAAFELSKGCSVGCKFCGLDAGPLETIFRATDENKKLWAEVMDVSMKIFGQATGEGSCYYGTEPLDNPDYEYYMEDWFDRFGRYGQITTAVATRNIERTRELLKRLDLSSNTIFRFSVKSKEEFETIIREFSPEELILVELIPQFEEAPGNAFSRAGRNVNNDDYAGSISCMSGFLVNMCEKSIRLITPTNASARFPLGQIEVMKEFFSNGKDFEEKIKSMISEMKTILTPSDKLSLYEYLMYNEEDGKIKIYNKTGTGLVCDIKEQQSIFIRILELLKSGLYTRKEIVEIVEREFNFPEPVYLHYLINGLWDKGLIVDKQLFA